MNSSDESTDKTLRRHFQQVFDDYQVEPSASLTRRIWQKIPSVADRYRWPVSLLLGGMLLVGTAVYYRSYRPLLKAYTRNMAAQYSQTATNNRMRTRSMAHLEPIKREPVDHNAPPLSTMGGRAVTFERNKRSERPALIARQAVARPLARKTDSVRDLDEQAGAGMVTTQRVKLSNQGPVKERTIQFNALPKSSESEPDESATAGRQPDQNLPVTSVSSGAEPSLVQRSRSVWQSLQPLSLHLNAGLSAHVNRSVQPFAAAYPVEQPANGHARVRWLANVMPLSTYQLMTVVARPDAYVQRVHTPAALSGPTWGYQLSAGVEWRKTTIQLTMGQIRRWAYYELATNTFDVESIGPRQYEVVPREQTVTENVSLTMLGVRIGRLHTLGRATSPYYVQFNGEASYVPHTHQSLVWAGASLGASLPLGRAYKLQVGPTISYGLSRLWSTQQQLIIHPYLVGVGLTLRPATLAH